MDKKGQIYILAAILLAIIIYGLSTIVNVIQQEEIKSDFGSLSKNYEAESSKLINSVLQSGGDVIGSFENFTFLFTSYSKSKSPSFHIFYALAYENEIHVGNFMDEPINISVPCPNPGEPCRTLGVDKKEVLGCLSDISAQMKFEGLTINADYLAGGFKDLRDKCTRSMSFSSGQDCCAVIGGIMYKLPLEENVPKIFSLSRLKSGEQALYSAQGEIGEEQFCGGGTEANCCSEFCCWDSDPILPNGGVCLEGKC